MPNINAFGHTMWGRMLFFSVLLKTLWVTRFSDPFWPCDKKLKTICTDLLQTMLNVKLAQKKDHLNDFCRGLMIIPKCKISKIKGLNLNFLKVSLHISFENTLTTQASLYPRTIIKTCLYRASRFGLIPYIKCLENTV